jgi:EmrB/QacA subfamily drug resistance transporter
MHMTATAVPPALAPFDRTSRSYRLRWYVLLVLCLSLLVIIVDNSILNIAIPTLQKELGATNSQLQWMIDSYTLVFAGLLLTAGTIGDRYGRRGALQFGMAVFGLGSLLSAFAGSAEHLIGTRALMGIGGAFIMPATLSILTNTFPPEERGRAIALWAAVAGVGGVLGPTGGGLLLAHFYWGSIFLVNIPIVVIALLAGVFIIPTSKDPTHARLDVVGAILSIFGLVTLVYAIIQAPEHGWSSATTLGTFALAAILLTAFGVWESRVEHPMLDFNFFKNPRFSAASSGITLIFFAMFGGTFLLTQYFQFVMGYSPLETGVRLLPWAATMLIVAPQSARLVEKFGTKRVVAVGLGLAGTSLALMSGLPAHDASYATDIVWRILLMAAGMALVMAPATESIMGSLPRAKAGVGSAVNDTTRQVGGALGVAVIGSVMTSFYASRVGDVIAKSGVDAPESAVEKAKDGLGFALGFAQQAPANVRGQLISDFQDAFVSGLHLGVIVAAVAAFIGMLVVLIWLPARAADTDVFVQQDIDEAALEARAALDGQADRDGTALSGTAPTLAPELQT